MITITPLRTFRPLLRSACRVRMIVIGWILVSGGLSSARETPDSNAKDPRRFMGLTEVNPPEDPNPTGTIVIHDVTLVDGRGGKPVEHAVVVVKGSTITAIGNVDESTAPRDAKVIDARGKTLLPGLLDPHLHIGRDPKIMMQRPSLILRHGVTSARDPGRAIEDYAALLASGIPLPRLFLTGKHFDQRPHAHPHNAIDIQSVRQAKETVDGIVGQGGSAIKVYYRLPIPLIEATCEQAHRHGIPVTAHLELVDADRAIEAGVAGLEHVTSCGTSIAEPVDAELFRKAVDKDNAARRPGRFRLWSRIDLEHPRVERFVKLLAEKQIVLTPTLNVFERRPGDQFNSEPYHVDAFRTMLRFVDMCHTAGVPIVASSHGKPPACREGWAMQHEMRLLHEAGLTPLEVIAASTSVPAKFFGSAERLGSVEVGKQADLVLYDGKPHENLDDLWRVDRVMQGGRWVGGPEPTFRLRRIGDKHRLIQPDGNSFVALGVNHIGAVARDRDYFARRYDGNWTKFRDHLSQQFDRWLMNCVGYGAPKALQQHFPYFATVTLARIEKHRSDPDPTSKHGYRFPDPFDPTWATDVDRRIREMCEQHRDNRMLVGYLWTDTPTWDVIKTRGLRGTDWVSQIRKQPGGSPGRRRYTEFLRSRYTDRLSVLNSLYSLELESLDALDTANLSSVAIGRQVVQADDIAFLEIVAERFYSVVGSSQRKHDPRHLVFGDRYLLGDHPTGVLRQAAKWIDAVAVQPGDLYSPLYPPSTRFAVREFRKIHEVTRAPILICDHAISFPTKQHPRTIFEQEPSEDKAALAISRFIEAAFEEPYILGYLKCQYIDRPSGFGRGLRQGLLTADGTERRAIVDAYAESFSKIVDEPSSDSRRSESREPVKRSGNRRTNPNILLVLADDLGWGDPQSYQRESKIPTPAIDRLANEGMRFTDAHTPSSVCTPTRYTLLTGRYCWRTRLKSGVLDGFDPPLIAPNQDTLATLLRRAGYRTHCVGKWHLGMRWTARDGSPVRSRAGGTFRPGTEVDFTKPVTGGPTAVGFDSYFGISASLDMSPYAFLRDDRVVGDPRIASPENRDGLFMNQVAGVTTKGFRLVDVLPRIATEASRVIREAADNEDPFFCYVPLTSPHLPVVPTPASEGRSRAGSYGDFVVATDQALDTLLRTLDDTKQANNTIVLFTSDNGGLFHRWAFRADDDGGAAPKTRRGEETFRFGHQSNASWRGTKADIYEGGHRVPFLVRWPGTTPAGSLCSSTVELTDVFATVAELVDEKPLGQSGMDSFSLLDCLRGATDFRARPFSIHHSLRGVFAVRQGRWKYIEGRGSGGFTRPRTMEGNGPAGQLYDLASDPQERTNRFEDEPERVRDLQKILAKVRQGGGE